MILMSDGYSDVYEGGTPGATAAEQLKATGVSVYTIGVSENSNLVELNHINSDPDVEYLFTVSAADQHQMAADQLLDRLCQ